VNTSQLPSTYSAGAFVTLASVSCPAAGDCVAVGTYFDSADHEQGLIDSESNGTWTVGEANLSALATYSNPLVDFTQVSCASTGNCAASGSYRDTSDDSEGLLETETNGVWTAGQANLSHLSVATDPSVDIESVSCATAGNCTAVGYYEDGTVTYQGLLLNEVGAAWQPATEAQLPADAAGETLSQEDLYVASVSCASAGDCTAVGTYDSTSANDVEGLQLIETNGTWAAGSETSLPAASNSNPEVWLASVSCASASYCVAGGAFEGADGNNQALFAQQSGGTWTTASVEQQTHGVGALVCDDREGQAQAQAPVCFRLGPHQRHQHREGQGAFDRLWASRGQGRSQAAVERDRDICGRQHEGNPDAHFHVALNGPR
jgi:hypothetical protein